MGRAPRSSTATRTAQSAGSLHRTAPDPSRDGPSRAFAVSRPLSAAERQTVCASVFVDVLRDDHLEHRLVAEPALRALLTELRDEYGVQQDRGWS